MNNELTQLKKLAEAATPGPWKATQEFANRWRIDPGQPTYYELASVYGHGDYERISKNADYIAAANPSAILSLIERIAELEKQLATQAQGVKIAIPTETMEQEFQNHYQLGYAAGRTKGYAAGKAELERQNVELKESYRKAIAALASSQGQQK